MRMREFLGRNDQPRAQSLFEMANIRPEATGLPFVVYVSEKGGARHDVRIKLARGPRVRPSEMISIPIHPSVRDPSGSLSASELQLVTRWIDLNRDVIIGYWDGSIPYTEDLLRQIRPVV